MTQELQESSGKLSKIKNVLVEDGVDIGTKIIGKTLRSFFALD